MKKSNKFSPEVLERAVRMVQEHRGEYLKDVLTRLPMHKARDIDQLLPHRWQPATN